MTYAAKWVDNYFADDAKYYVRNITDVGFNVLQK